MTIFLTNFQKSQKIFLIVSPNYESYHKLKIAYGFCVIPIFKNQNTYTLHCVKEGKRRFSRLRCVNEVTDFDKRSNLDRTDQLLEINTYHSKHNEVEIRVWDFF